ncbi:MAG: F0F1 ATP synthase subunit beta, partial [Fibrobacteres bacterium]|nr:F0F1 ATP synthase subunit beta [Fibrobacterota bacterium]
MAAQEVNGKIRQVTGAVVDVEFPEKSLPPIKTALKVTNPSTEGGEWNLTLEVSQQLGEGVVRTISMGSTDGLSRGLPVMNTASPIT